MKRILIILLCLICVGSVARAGPVVWTLGDYNLTGLQIGYQWKTVEIGGSAFWWMWEKESRPHIIGGYLHIRPPGEIDLSAIPIFGELVGEMPVATYIGLRIGLEGDQVYLGPAAGIVLRKFIFDKVDDNIETGTEIQLTRYAGEEKARIAFFMRYAF